MRIRPPGIKIMLESNPLKSIMLGELGVYGYSLQGGAVGGGYSRRGVQWIGVVLCNKLVYNII